MNSSTEKTNHLTSRETMSKRTDAQILRDLQAVECGLSPENLTCDGEASPAWVRKRSADLNRQKRALIKELGRTPSDRELYGF
jgi:hypothetical protein